MKTLLSLQTYELNMGCYDWKFEFANSNFVVLTYFSVSVANQRTTDRTTPPTSSVNRTERRALDQQPSNPSRQTAPTDRTPAKTFVPEAAPETDGFLLLLVVCASVVGSFCGSSVTV